MIHVPSAGARRAPAGGVRGVRLFNVVIII